MEHPRDGMADVDTTPAYIAKWPDCGCLVMAVVDEPTHAKDTARELARCVRDGLAVERTTVEAVRAMSFPRCPHRPPRRRVPTSDSRPRCGEGNQGAMDLTPQQPPYADDVATIAIPIEAAHQQPASAPQPTGEGSDGY